MNEVKAQLICEIPQKRFRTIDGSVPKVGDTVVLDQGFHFKSGEAGCLVYGINIHGQFTYEAEVYEKELSSN